MDWTAGFDAGARPRAESPLFAFAGDRLLVADGEAIAPLRAAALPPGALEQAVPVQIGRIDEEPAFVVGLAEPVEAGGLTALGLRDVLARATVPVASAATRAAQTLEWDLAHRFCGRCGSPTEPSPSELTRLCPRCGATSYPRLTPAVIMLVEREDRILLARRAGATTGFWSCLAGFVEPGETLEEAVAREVREEVGVEVDAVEYAGSQPWPFPSQLMIGFRARYAGGELRPDPAEIGDAGWFRPGELPPVPPPFTIARTLIDAFCDRAAA